MKILYCINGTFHAGGMERILSLKANYLADNIGDEVYIVTVNQNNRPNFFTFSSKIIFFDLGINYRDCVEKNRWVRFVSRNFKKIIHRRRLNCLLQKIKPDICISMFDMEVDLLYKIKDGSKKILEYHFSKNAGIVEPRNVFMHFRYKMLLKKREKIIQKYDSFVVLTEEDKQNWGDIPNIRVISNFIVELPECSADLTEKRVLSVGRLDYQKGFDYLIKIWSKVYSFYPDWQLYIFGNGEKKEELSLLIENLGLSHCVFLMPATVDIGNEYLHSSIYVSTSRWEGFSLVLLEAMSYGLPIVSFTYSCGPKELINKSIGSLAPLGDIDVFASELMKWMENRGKREIAGKNARQDIQKYLQIEIMQKWKQLFDSLVSETSRK